MAAGTAPIFPANVSGGGVTIVNSDSTNKKTVYTAGSDGALLRGVAVTSDDTARVMQVYLTLGGTDYLVGIVDIGANAGTATLTPSVNLLSISMLPWLNPDGSLSMPPSSVLKVAVTVAVTSAKTITVVAIGGGYS